MKREQFPKRISIHWLKYQYEKETLTPSELVEELILRREEHREYNIWIQPLGKDQIQTYIKQLMLKDKNLPLWGIPFAIKDNIDLAGVPTTAACPEYAYTPNLHATVVQRLIDAGAIPMGKTNLDQFATGLVGTRSPYGEVHNSLMEELISGGSSSGSAVSVALGEVVFALGTDTAGSGRVPAALNNLIGYKPSIGAWPIKGLVPACASLDCITVLTDELQDAYAVDAVVRGKEEQDMWSKEYPNPQSLLPESILLPDAQPIFYGPYSKEYAQTWEQSVKQINKMGIPVEFISCELFSKSAAILYGGPWVAERWTDLKEFVEGHEDDVFPVTKTILKGACKEEFDASSVFEAMHQLQEYKREVELLMKNAILILPTCGGTYTRDQVRENPIATNNDMGLYTNHCNLLDLSAIAVPSGFAGDKLPFGITAFALAKNENYLKGFAEAYEKEHVIPIAVCGLHMRGFALEHQLVDLQAEYVETVKTAPCYKMYCLNSIPKKPVLVKDKEGTSLEVEIWNIPQYNLGKFMIQVPAPLALGKIHLEDGKEVIGFIGQMYQELGQDITMAGGWRYANCEQF